VNGMTSVKPEKSYEAPVGAATLVTTLAILVMTIGAELYPPLKAWLASTFGHHWVGKGVISIVIFVVVMALSYPILTKTPRSMASWSNRLFAVVILVTAIIIGFFMYEFLFP